MQHPLVRQVVAHRLAALWQVDSAESLAEGMFIQLVMSDEELGTLARYL